jgi:hypothetical protein
MLSSGLKGDLSEASPAQRRPQLTAQDQSSDLNLQARGQKRSKKQVGFKSPGNSLSAEREDSSDQVDDTQRMDSFHRAIEEDNENSSNEDSDQKSYRFQDYGAGVSKEALKGYFTKDEVSKMLNQVQEDLEVHIQASTQNV